MEWWRVVVLPGEIVDGAAEAGRLISLLTQVVHLIALIMILVEELFDILKVVAVLGLNEGGRRIRHNNDPVPANVRKIDIPALLNVASSRSRHYFS